MLEKFCPTFPSRDLAATAAFYQQLGFETLGLYPEEGYLLIHCQGHELHFWRHPDHRPETSDHGAYLRVRDANAWSDELVAKDLPTEGIPRVTRSENKAWGMCELAIVDPDGNLIRAGHVLPD